MAKLSAHGEEIKRLRKVGPSGTSSVTISFRSDGAVLQKIKNGTYDSGWKLRTRHLQNPIEVVVSNLKEKGWEEVS